MASQDTKHIWYGRPIFFVDDVMLARRFYLDKLGFTLKWHEADGEGTVCQVDRGGCEIILCENKNRKDRNRIFLELSKAAVEQMKKELAEKGIVYDVERWGYICARIADPDGNELLVCLENLL